jgi:NAD(P)-dependent dehydrogenase (short-subunit alcohol dehydrogenase family)
MSTLVADLNRPDDGKLQERELAGRVAIITGGGQGLGRAFALGFAARGAIPVIADINDLRARAVADEVRAAGGEALSVATDIGDYASVETMIERTMREFGRLDILVNCAAIFSTLEKRPFDEIPLDEWQRVIHVNVTGMYYCCRAAVPAMRAAGWGRIINLSSSTVVTGRPNYLHYTTSKAAVVGLTRSLAREVGRFGITANALMPGATTTEVERKTVTPAQKEAIVAAQSIPRPEVPEDLVGVVLFLSSEASRFMTGQTLLVDGGLAHL